MEINPYVVFQLRRKACSKIKKYASVYFAVMATVYNLKMFIINRDNKYLKMNNNLVIWAASDFPLVNVIIYRMLIALF